MTHTDDVDDALLEGQHFSAEARIVVGSVPAEEPTAEDARDGLDLELIDQIISWAGHVGFSLFKTTWLVDARL
jgi:hypothetical protein